MARVERERKARKDFQTQAQKWKNWQKMSLRKQQMQPQIRRSQMANEHTYKCCSMINITSSYCQYRKRPSEATDWVKTQTLVRGNRIANTQTNDPLRGGWGGADFPMEVTNHICQPFSSKAAESKVTLT